MSRHRTESMLSHGVDYIIILPRALARLAHSLAVGDKSRRVAPGLRLKPPLSGQSLRGQLIFDFGFWILD